MQTAEFVAFTHDSPPPAPSHVPPLPLSKGLPWVALGGAVGALTRWGVGQILPATTTFTLVDLPWGTFIANVIGCFLLGALSGITDVRPLRKPQVQLAVGVGFCGGFTTMSTFVLEVAVMLGARFPLEAFQYTVTSVVFCVGAVVIGFILGRIVMRRIVSAQTPSSPDEDEQLEGFADVPSNDIVVGAVGVDDTGEKQ